MRRPFGVPEDKSGGRGRENTGWRILRNSEDCGTEKITEQRRFWDGDMTERKVRITVAEGGMTVEQYLKQNLGFSKRQVSSLKFRPDGVCVNGGRQRVNRLLQAGDCLELLLESRKAGAADGAGQTLYRGPELTVLYEDADLLAVEKPAGLVCHHAHGHYGDTLADWAASRAAGRGERWNVRIVGRLDRDTSGVVVIARNAETAALLARQRERGEMKKTYLALVEGRPESGCGQVELPIRKDRESLVKMTVAPAEEKDGVSAVWLPARTWYQVLETRDGCSLVRLRLEHGRTHQIRVHMAAIGHPLCGDPLYGSGSDRKGDLAKLHAWKTELLQPFTGERLSFTAELPDWCAGFSALSCI